jgi:putative addiction module component (TIGR02574 family)
VKPEAIATTMQQLTVEERLELVQDLWDSIAADVATLPLTEAESRLLDERLDEYEVDRDPGEPVDVVVARIQRLL